MEWEVDVALMTTEVIAAGHSHAPLAIPIERNSIESESLRSRLKSGGLWSPAQCCDGQAHPGMH